MIFFAALPFVVFCSVYYFYSLSSGSRSCGMAGTRRALAVFLVFLFCLEPVCFALKTEKILADFPAVSGQARVAVEAASGMIFARFRAGINSETKKKYLAAAGLTILKEFDSTGWTLVGLPDGMTVAGGLALAKNITGLESAGSDRAYRVKLTPNDPLFSSRSITARCVDFKSKRGGGCASVSSE